MGEEKSLVEQMLDLFVYAPVGMALTAGEELPKLIEKGRTRVTGQVTMARMMGQFAVQQGQQQAGKLVKEATERLNDLGVVPSSRPASSSPSTSSSSSSRSSSSSTRQEPAPATDAASGGAPAHHDRDTATPAEEAAAAQDTPVPPTNGTNGSRPRAAADLAIPGYDSLSASQVVQRLAGLSGEELEAVRAYESASRGRKTILGRIAQLQAGSA